VCREGCRTLGFLCEPHSRDRHGMHSTADVTPVATVIADSIYAQDWRLRQGAIEALGKLGAEAIQPHTGAVSTLF